MKKILQLTSTIVLALSSLVSLWFLLNNMQPLSPGLYSFAVLCLLGVGVFLSLFARDFLKNVRAALSKATHQPYFTPIVIIISLLLAVLARLYFYVRFSYNPVSDPITFYDTAQQLANGHGIQGDSYPVFFPFLAAYDNLLGVAMKVIHNPWLATIALNTLFDIGAAFIVYFLVKKLTKQHSKLPVLAFAVWLLSPFNILFSVLSLPIVIVNFFIVATILVVYLLVQKISAKQIAPSLGLAALLGIVIGLGNCFRPTFTIAIVALVLLFVYVLIAHRKEKLLLLMGACFIVIVVIFLGIQKLDLALINSETGLVPPPNPSGWTIYIGANSSTNGTWNLADQNAMSQICKDQTSVQDCHDKLRKVGLDRYKSYGLTGTINLFIRKLYVFSSDQSNTYNANDSLTNYTGSSTQKVFGIYITLFMVVLFSLSAWFLYATVKTKEPQTPAILFIALLILGFFLSDMFVETAERYAQVLYPLFLIAAVLSLETFHKRSRHTR